MATSEISLVGVKILTSQPLPNYLGLYAAGTVCGFEPADADMLVALGLAIWDPNVATMAVVDQGSTAAGLCY